MLSTTPKAASAPAAVQSGMPKSWASQSQNVASVNIAILALPGFPIGEFAQITDVFTLASEANSTTRFQWDVYGAKEGRVRSSAGIEIPCRACTALERVGKYLIIIGPRPHDPDAWSTVASAVRLWHRNGGSIMGVGDAVEVLAVLGLLDGKRACAHWQARRALSEQHHDVEFENRIFVLDGANATCAGASATADFVLDFVGRVTSQAIADRLASRLNCETRRSGQHAQRHVNTARFGKANRAFVSAIELIQRMDNEKLEPNRIAAAVGVSNRQLQRLFRRYLKRTPSQHLRAYRLQQAKELLTRTPMSITEVALATGFANPSHFAVRYAKAFGLSPSAQRDARHNQ
jgi:transcriptional regulator GlxA family with amidase domain